MLTKVRGIAQLPVLLGLSLMALVLPLVSYLAQSNQDNRNRAAYSCSETTHPSSSCVISGVTYGWTCNNQTGAWECKVTAPVVVSTLIPTNIPTINKSSTIAPPKTTPTLPPNCACLSGFLSGTGCSSLYGQACGGTIIPTINLPTKAPTSTPMVNLPYGCFCSNKVITGTSCPSSVVGTSCQSVAPTSKPDCSGTFTRSAGCKCTLGYNCASGTKCVADGYNLYGQGVSTKVCVPDSVQGPCLTTKGKPDMCACDNNSQCLGSNCNKGRCEFIGCNVDSGKDQYCFCTSSSQCASAKCSNQQCVPGLSPTPTLIPTPTINSCSTTGCTYNGYETSENYCTDSSGKVGFSQDSISSFLCPKPKGKTCEDCNWHQGNTNNTCGTLNTRIIGKCIIPTPSYLIRLRCHPIARPDGSFEVPDFNKVVSGKGCYKPLNQSAVCYTKEGKAGHQFCETVPGFEACTDVGQFSECFSDGVDGTIHRQDYMDFSDYNGFVCNSDAGCQNQFNGVWPLCDPYTLSCFRNI